MADGASKDADDITVSVKCGAQTLSITMPSMSTVKDLMARLQELTNVLPRGQKLIFKGKVLDTELTMVGAKLTNGSKIMLMASEGVHKGGKLKNVLEALHMPKMGKTIEKTRVGAWQATGIVSLRESHVQTVPKDVWALGSAVRILDLSGNSIRAIPAEISALINLQRLRLTSNGLTDTNIQWQSLGSLKSLSHLAFDHNRLTSLPAEIGKLSSLKHLSLSHNQVQSLPDEIGDLAQLEELDVSHNKLTAIPPSLGQCAQLSGVDFSANHLTSIPSSLSKLQSLKVMLLNNNSLTSFPGEILTGCPELITLSLHGNEITVDRLRTTEGWPEFDKRRRSKYSKQLDFNVIGSSGGFDEGADAQQWKHW